MAALPKKFTTLHGRLQHQQGLLKCITGLVTFSLVLPVPLYGASIVVDNAAAQAHRATLGAASNGVQMIDIVTANAQGLSHNKFSDYNVGQTGLILNNATADVQSLLGGGIRANKNLGGISASLILNEVTGTGRSLLQGYQEVAGQAADIVIANPNGITCRGCGFINTPQATLTTGMPQFNNGVLTGFEVRGGDITIDGSGLDATEAQRFNLVTRSLIVEGQLKALDLGIFTGNSDYDYAGRSASAVAATAGAPSYLVDSSALGGIYANRIMLVGNEAGVGVRVRADLIAFEGELELSNDGDIIFDQARLQAKQSITLANSGHKLELSNNTELYSQADIEITTENWQQKNSSVIADGTLNINTATDLMLDNAALSSVGRLTLFGADITLSNGSRVVADADIKIDNSASNVIVNNSLLAGADAVYLKAKRLSIDAQSVNSDGKGIISNKSITLDVEDNINNDGEIISHGYLGIVNYSGDLENNGLLYSGSNGTFNSSDIHSESLINNGVIDSSRQIWNASENIDNKGIIHSNSNVFLGRSGGSFLNRTNAEVSSGSGGVIQLKFGDVNNYGLIKSGGHFQSDISGNNTKFSNNGTIYSDGGMGISASSVINNGELLNNGSQTFSIDSSEAGASFSNTAKILSAGAVVIDGFSTVANADGAKVSSKNNITITADALTLAENSALLSEKNLKIDISSKLSLPDFSTLYGNAVEIVSSGLELAADASLSSFTQLVIESAGDFINASNIETDEFTVSAYNIDNSGTLLAYGSGASSINRGSSGAQAYNFDNSGTIYTAGNLAIGDLDSANNQLSLFNNSGKIQGNDVMVEINGLIQNSGDVIALNDLIFNGDRGNVYLNNSGLASNTSLDNSGTLWSNGRLAINSMLALSNQAAGLIYSKGEIAIGVGLGEELGDYGLNGGRTLGSFSNLGAIYAETNDNDAVFRFKVTGDFNNSGEMIFRWLGGAVATSNGNPNVEVSAGNIDNQGTLEGDGYMSLLAGTFQPTRGYFDSQDDLVLTEAQNTALVQAGQTRPAGLVYAYDDRIKKGNIVNHGGGVISSAGKLDVIAHGNLENGSSADALGGRIASGGDLTVLLAKWTDNSKLREKYHLGKLHNYTAGEISSQGALRLGGESAETATGSFTIRPTEVNNEGNIYASGDADLGFMLSHLVYHAINKLDFNNSGGIQVAGKLFVGGYNFVNTGSILNFSDTTGSGNESVNLEFYYVDNYGLLWSKGDINLEATGVWDLEVNNKAGATIESLNGSVTFNRFENNIIGQAIEVNNAGNIFAGENVDYFFPTYSSGGPTFTNSGIISAVNTAWISGFNVNNYGTVQAANVTIAASNTLNNSGGNNTCSGVCAPSSKTAATITGGGSSVPTVAANTVSPGSATEATAGGITKPGSSALNSVVPSLPTTTTGLFVPAATNSGYLIETRSEFGLSYLSTQWLLDFINSQNPPVVSEPVVEEPVVEEPVVEEPVVEEPVVEEPVVEEPVVEEPVIEEPVVEEPVIEEPVIEEPVIEEPVIEQPVEPTVKELVAETVPEVVENSNQNLRLGDGYYETMLVRDQITSLTQQRFIFEGVNDDAEQFMQLMQNAAAEYQPLGLALGVELTAQQVSNLNRDIIWLVEVEVNGQTALAPKVYLTEATLASIATGGKVLGDRVSLSGKNTTNTGTVDGNKVSVTGTETVLNRGLVRGRQYAELGGGEVYNEGVMESVDGQVVFSGSNLRDAGRVKTDHVELDLDGEWRNQGKLNGLKSISGEVGQLINRGTNLEADNIFLKAGDVDNSKGSILAENLVLRSDKDINNREGSIEAGNVVLEAANNIDNSKGRIIAQGMMAGQASIRAGNDVINDGGVMGASNVLSVNAGNNVSNVAGVIGAKTTIVKTERGDIINGAGEAKRVKTENGWIETAAVGAIRATDDLVIDAGRDFINTASEIKAGGNAVIKAGRDVKFQTINLDSHYSKSTSKKAILTATTTTHTSDRTTVIGSTVEIGGNAVVTAGNDVKMQNINMQVGKKAFINAGRDVVITGGESTENTYKKKYQGDILGHSQEEDWTEGGTWTGSTIGSQEGLAINAGRDAKVIGSTVVSEGKVGIYAGRDVSIISAETMMNSRYKDDSARVFGSGSSSRDKSGVEAKGTIYEESQSNGYTDTTTVNRSTIVSATSDVEIVAGGKATLESVNMLAGENSGILIVADEIELKSNTQKVTEHNVVEDSLNIGVYAEATTTQTGLGVDGSRTSSTRHTVTDTQVVNTLMAGSKGVTLVARDGDINDYGSVYNTSGKLIKAAEGSINDFAVKDVVTETYTETKSGGRVGVGVRYSTGRDILDLIDSDSKNEREANNKANSRQDKNGNVVGVEIGGGYGTVDTEEINETARVVTNNADGGVVYYTKTGDVNVQATQFNTQVGGTQDPTKVQIVSDQGAVVFDTVTERHYNKRDTSYSGGNAMGGKSLGTSTHKGNAGAGGVVAGGHEQNINTTDNDKVIVSEFKGSAEVVVFGSKGVEGVVDIEARDSVDIVSDQGEIKLTVVEQKHESVDTLNQLTAEVSGSKADNGQKGSSKSVAARSANTTETVTEKKNIGSSIKAKNVNFTAKGAIVLEGVSLTADRVKYKTELGKVDIKKVFDTTTTTQTGSDIQMDVGHSNKTGGNVTKAVGAKRNFGNRVSVDQADKPTIVTRASAQSNIKEVLLLQSTLNKDDLSKRQVELPDIDD